MVLCCGLICNCACRKGWQVLEREGSYLAFGLRKSGVADGCSLYEGEFRQGGLWRNALRIGSVIQ